MRKEEFADDRPPTSVNDEGLVQQDVEAAEEIIHALDGSVFGNGGLQRLHEPLRDIALEERATGAALVYQLVAMLLGIFHHVVAVAAVDDVHRRLPLMPENNAFPGSRVDILSKTHSSRSDRSDV